MAAAPRIVSLISSATEMVCGLGLQDRLVGISHECDYPPSITSLPRVTQTRISPTLRSQAIDDQVRSQLAAGEPLYDVDTQLLEELAPDLILTQAQCDVCAVRLADVEEAVARSACLQETRIISLNPESLSDVLSDIRRIDEAVGSEKNADVYLQALEARVERVRWETAPLCKTRRRRVALIEWIEPLMLSGNWMPELIAMAGGEHALTQAGKHSPYVSWQDIVDYDPEVVIIAPCGFQLERTLEETDLLTQLPQWKSLSATKAGRAVAMDGNAYFNRSGPRLVDSLEILAHLIYPEAVATPECVAEPDKIWRKLA